MSGARGNVLESRRVAVVFGRTGAGKTVLARALLNEWRRELGADGLIVDTLGEHADVPRVELADVPGWLALSAGRPSPGLVRVTVETHDDMTELGRHLAERPAGRPVVLYVDEASYWAKPAWTSPGLAGVVRYGRHYGVHLLAVARRAAEVSRELTAQAGRLYLFRVVEPRDLQYLSGILPASVSTILRQLPARHYLEYSPDGTYSICPPVKISAS